jgi:ABC-type molybdate transport system substrate-binding protein
MNKKTFWTFFLVWGMASPPTWAAEIFGPWTEPPKGGVTFTVPCIDDVPDLHGDLHNPDLVIFFGGNQFMVLPELMAAFKAQNPEIQHIYYETLPPGIIEQQLKTGSLVMGNLKISIKPDLFIAGKERIDRLDQEGYFLRTRPYFKNRLAIMVADGNPKQIRSLMDLGRDDINVSMPDPAIEGVAQKIAQAMRKAGGDNLVSAVMETKKAAGTTFITQIHHRQTPMRIMANQSDAGPVWETEVIFQKMINNPIEVVEISVEHNVSGTGAAAILKDAPHQRSAEKFLEFLVSKKSADIYRKYGFQPVQSE